MIYLESLAMAHKDDKSLGKHCALAKIFAVDCVSCMCSSCVVAWFCRYASSMY